MEASNVNPSAAKRDRSSEPSTKYTRSRSGCLTCRKRKKRCDELKPYCNTCQRLSLECIYPEVEESKRGKVRKRSQPERRRLGPDTPMSATGDLEWQQTPLYQSVEAALAIPPGAGIQPYDDSRELTMVAHTPPRETHHTNPASGGVIYYGFPAEDDQKLQPASPIAEPGHDFYFGESGLDLERGDSGRDSNHSSPLVSLSTFPSPIMDFRVPGISSIPLQPSIALPPRITLESMLILPPTEQFRDMYPDLGATAFELLEYFHAQQLNLKGASPLNTFRSFALMFSLHSRVNLFGVLAWTAWHRGSKAIAQKYFDAAVDQLNRDSTISNEEMLVALLVLTSAKICSSDPEGWQPHLQWASQTMKRYGGIPSFMQSETSRWLLLHFAYLEILSVPSMTLPKLLSTGQFEFIFRRPPSSALPEPICSCSEPVLLMIERVNELSRFLRVAVVRGESLEEVYSSAQAIEEQTWALQPSMDKIGHMSITEQRIQTRQFELFKLVTVLHLYQSVLRMNSAATPIQVLAHRLLAAITDLIDTSVDVMLVFPLFVLGVNLSNEHMRQQLLNHFDRLFARIHTRSVQRVKLLIQKVWAMDCAGTRHIDWTELVDQNFDFRCV